MRITISWYLFAVLMSAMSCTHETDKVSFQPYFKETPQSFDPALAKSIDPNVMPRSAPDTKSPCQEVANSDKIEQLNPKTTNPYIGETIVDTKESEPSKGYGCKGTL